MEDRKVLEDLGGYKYGFRDPETYVFKSRKGLDRQVVEQISNMKEEPKWMLEFRLRALDHFMKRPMPSWGADLAGLDLDDIYYYVRPTEKQGRSWDEVPETIKQTFDRLGIPEAERRFLAGVGAQYESEMVYHSIQEHLEKQGVIFLAIEDGLKQYPDLFREYFGTVIPIEDNKFAALNGAVWSGGSFVYVPPGVKVDLPLQAYFRLNVANIGQFERSLIIVDEGAQVHYVEGCTAPQYTTDSFHSGVIEIIVKRGARSRYTTIQNWSTNVYNLVTQRAKVYADATHEWVDANLGCLAEGSTVTTPEGIKTIESLNVGDRVLSYDEATGKLCFRTVTAKRFSGHQPVHTVAVGERRLQVTANHPFYSYHYNPDNAKKSGRYRFGYVRADELKEAIVPRKVNIMGVECVAHGSYRLSFLPDERLLPFLSQQLQEESQVRYSRKNEMRRTVGRSKLTLGEDVEIVSVNVSPATQEAIPTWDIEVEGAGNFVSQGFIVHNSKLTMKYPSCYLMEPGARGEMLSMAFAGPGQHQDAGSKMVHFAPRTSSKITSKSISKGGGRASYRGLLKVYKGAVGVKSNVVCDALLLDPQSRSDTYPYIEIDEDDVAIGHEASVSKVGEEQLFYLMSRGLSQEEATTMVVSGFIEPLVKELPMEYAVEMNRLIQLQMEGSIG